MDKEIIRPGDPGIRRGRGGDGLAHLGTGILRGGVRVMTMKMDKLDNDVFGWNNKNNKKQQQHDVNSSHLD